MTDSGSGNPGLIFISYRREDAPYPAGWLFERLAEHYGADRVFKDVDSIEFGDDFAEAIAAAVGSCAVLLAVIGPQWLAITDEDGHRRLDNPEDFVRLEIEAALERGVRVIPVLVAGARMPRSGHLPESLQPLARRHALELTHSRFKADCDQLIRVLDKTLAQTPTAPVQGGRAAKSPGADDAQPRRPVPMELISELHPYDLGLAVTDLSPLPWALRPLKTGVTTKQIAFSPDRGRKLLAAADSDEKVRVWDVAGQAIIRLLSVKGARSVAFSPDGQLLAAGGQDARVRLWSVADWSEERELVPAHAPVDALAFSPDGALLASGGQHNVALRDVAIGHDAIWLTSLAEGTGIFGVAFSPDGLLLACAGSMEKVLLFDVARGIPMYQVPTPGAGAYSVAFSPDGRLLAFSTPQVAVRLWDLEAHAEIRRFDGPAGFIWSVAFSPDGALLAAGGNDMKVWLWEVATGKLAETLSGHDKEISSLAFSPDGRLLASADNGGAILLWE